jgi:hypothetical protein
VALVVVAMVERLVKAMLLQELLIPAAAAGVAQAPQAAQAIQVVQV